MKDEQKPVDDRVPAAWTILIVRHCCSLCEKDCGGCRNPAHECAWLMTHEH